MYVSVNFDHMVFLLRDDITIADEENLKRLCSYENSLEPKNSALCGCLWEYMSRKIWLIFEDNSLKINMLL